MSAIDSTFVNMFNEQLEPTLEICEFQRVQLQKGWIQPEFLYKHVNGDIWFSCSWDWRDQYFDAELGSLYYMKDVLPRVVVLGISLRKLRAGDVYEYLSEQLNNIAKNLDDLLSKISNGIIDFDIVQQNRVNQLSNYISGKVNSLEALPLI